MELFAQVLMTSGEIKQLSNSVNCATFKKCPSHVRQNTLKNA